MSDLVVIDLWQIHRSDVLLAELHAAQKRRLAERHVTGGDRPEGMRLSIADPIRRVKSAFDPFWLINFNDGLAERGYLVEDYAEVALYHGLYEPYSSVEGFEAQTPVQWHKHGRTAHDFVTEIDAASVPESIKSKDPKERRIENAKPSTDNVAQERRMMALGGYPAESRFNIWMGDIQAMKLVGPYQYTLEQEHIDEARTELEGVTAAHDYFARILQGGGDPTTTHTWNDEREWADKWNLVSSSGAFHYTRLDASAAIERRVVMDVKRRNDLAEAKREADLAKALIEPHVREQIALARVEDPTAKSVRALGWVAGEVTYTLVERADGGSYIKYTFKPHAEEQAA